MPDLGKKFECYNCRTKFYNLGKPEAICPKCGANQKDAKSEEAPAPAPRPPRRAILMDPIPDEQTTNEFGAHGSKTNKPWTVAMSAIEVPDSPRVVEEEEY